MSKRYLVLGASGTIGHQMVKHLKQQGRFVRAVDIQRPLYSASPADEKKIADLTKEDSCLQAMHSEKGFDQVIQLAAVMGGATFIFTGKNDAEIMSDSAQININVLKACNYYGYKNIFFSSSACVYPQHLQKEARSISLHESLAFPANPDSVYGFEKLFSELLYDSYRRNNGFNVSIGRYHNIFGPECHYKDERAKAPAAICYKVANAKDGDTIDIIGDGNQVRSFLSVEQCIEGTLRLIESGYTEPVNIGSEESISINDFTAMVMRISGKRLSIRHVDGPQGVRGRNSNNDLLRKVTGWEPTEKLETGITRLYNWVNGQI